MEIRVTAKSVYGETKFYPVNFEACILAEIAGTKTLTLGALRLASKLGSVTVDGDETLRRLVAA